MIFEYIVLYILNLLFEGWCANGPEEAIHSGGDGASSARAQPVQGAPSGAPRVGSVDRNDPSFGTWLGFCE